MLGRAGRSRVEAAYRTLAVPVDDRKMLFGYADGICLERERYARHLPIAVKRQRQIVQAGRHRLYWAHAAIQRRPAIARRCV